MEALSDESMRARDQSLLQAFFSWLLTPPLLPFCPPAPATTPAHLPTARPSPLRASSLEPPPPPSSSPPLLASVPTLCVLPPPLPLAFGQGGGAEHKGLLGRRLSGGPTTSRESRSTNSRQPVAAATASSSPSPSYCFSSSPSVGGLRHLHNHIPPAPSSSLHCCCCCAPVAARAERCAAGRGLQQPSH